MCSKLQTENMCTSEEITLLTDLAAGFSEWESESENEPCVNKVSEENKEKTVTFEENKNEESVTSEMNTEEYDEWYYSTCGQPFGSIEEEEEIDIPCGQKIPDILEENTVTLKGVDENKLSALKQVLYKPPETILVDYLFHTPSYAFHPLITHHPVIPLPLTIDEFEKIGK